MFMTHRQIMVKCGCSTGILKGMPTLGAEKQSPILGLTFLVRPSGFMANSSYFDEAHVTSQHPSNFLLCNSQPWLKAMSSSWAQPPPEEFALRKCGHKWRCSPCCQLYHWHDPWMAPMWVLGSQGTSLGKETAADGPCPGRKGGFWAS